MLVAECATDVVGVGPRLRTESCRGLLLSGSDQSYALHSKFLDKKTRPNRALQPIFDGQF